MRPLTDIGRLPQTSVLLTADGRLLAPIFEQNRISVPIEQIAEPVLRCLLATEDRRFFVHGGVDLRAILRATYVNFRERKIVQGGSTITQQLARMAALQRSDRSLRRKLAEVYVALLIERHLTKRQILHRYLNAAYFGHGIFGIEQAALALCGKRAIQLDDSDAAYLVALLKAPARYCRCCNPVRAEQRTSIVTRLSGTRGEFRSIPNGKWRPRESYSSRAPLTGSYAIELIRKCLLQLAPQDYPQQRLKICTTIDPICQDILESACASVTRLGYTGRLACIIQDARSGSVRAIAGGTGFREQRFNAAADGLLQPGSLLKPFILLAAIRAALSVEAAYVSRPLSVRLRDGRIWTVRNAGDRYTGLTTIADATVHSDNTVYAQLLQEIGLERVKRILMRVGVPAQNATLAISTGAVRPGVSPLKMCSAYSVFSAAGCFFSPSIITRITSEDGNVLHDDPQIGRSICTVAEASSVTSVLQRVATEGTGRLPIAHSGLAAKTGTSISGGWYASFDGVHRILTWTESDFSPFSPRYFSGKAVSAKELANRIWHLLTKAQLGFQELFTVFSGVDKMSVPDLLWVEKDFETT
jgi:membrane peptidoglycan carboxypeptidase